MGTALWDVHSLPLSIGAGLLRHQVRRRDGQRGEGVSGVCVSELRHDDVGDPLLVPAPWPWQRHVRRGLGPRPQSPRSANCEVRDLLLDLHRGAAAKRIRAMPHCHAPWVAPLSLLCSGEQGLRLAARGNADPDPVLDDREALGVVLLRAAPAEREPLRL